MYDIDGDLLITESDNVDIEDFDLLISECDNDLNG